MKKTIMITEASFGTGKVMSLYFAKQGWNVVATLHKLCDVNELAEHSSILIKQMNVADITSIENVILDSIDTFGGIDVVLNNGIYANETMNVMRAILPHFRIRNKGKLIHVNPNAENIAATVYELADGNILKRYCFPDDFDFLLD
ncbi:hypothetical protein A9P82_06945 [Arachidicoccus ginsenosidimutans]|uniref:SDR family NAD(P)-dependent oxidoreductase n=1 Tax=Arachidicoccus sp. BS20 TaxID=1850526 RepID=UPI0007F0BBD4|nr:SDR family NAD(P)-dependent oxidoreductase [Arachidicoccus sp. BS20]ANI89050.1 hypothetical protein A9P82_06945 [Arachidicoccus sp. BS20]